MQRKLILMRKLSNIRMLDSMIVDRYIQIVDEIRNELVAIGHKVNELDLIHTILGGLPSSWGPFVSTFASKLTDATPSSYSDLIERSIARSTSKAIREMINFMKKLSTLIDLEVTLEGAPTVVVDPMEDETSIEVPSIKVIVLPSILPFAIKEAPHFGMDIQTS